MNFTYDERLDQNPFFQAIRENRADIVKKATEESWIICVPRVGTVEPSTISTDDILEHILVPNVDLPVTHFTNLAKHAVSIRDRLIVLNDEEPIRILFDETFYVDKSRKYKLWCIERPIHQNRVATDPIDHLTMRNVHDCIKLLWTKEQNVLKDVNEVIEKYLTADRFDFVSVEDLKRKYSVLYEDCIDVLAKGARVSDNLSLAIETYMQHCIHHKLFRAVCNDFSRADGDFNKIVRNLADIHLRDLDIGDEFFDCILSVKMELSNINKAFTTLGKIKCLQQVVNLLSVRKKSIVTTDDLLKIFVFLIIKSNENNWIGNLNYIMHCRCSPFSLSNENSFIITTLEAAIQYVKNEDVCFKNYCDHASFFAYIQQGDLSAIKKSFDVKPRNSSTLDETPLCHPLCSCDKCKSLLPVSIHSCNEQGCTALHVACKYGHPLVVDYFISKNLDINSLDYSESTPLHYACLKGNQNAILLLLHANAVVAHKNCEGNTPLHLAANNGHENCVKALLYFVEQKGHLINVNCRNSIGNTPLHLAAKWGYTGITNILLQYGADLNLLNRKNRSVFDVAHNDHLLNLLSTSKNLHADVVRQHHGTILKQNGLEDFKKINLVLKSIENNDLPLTCYLLGIPSPQCTSSLNSKQTCHPLCACDGCRKQFETTNESPNTVRNGEILNINACNYEGHTPLHAAAKHGRTDILRLLLDSGASVNVKTTKHQCTPLHVACKYQRIQVVRELLKCGGCELDVQDARGNTPLHYACLSNDGRIVELLLSHESDCNVNNVDGNTPLKEAENRMLNSIVKLLKEKCENDDRPGRVDDLFAL